MKIKERNNKFYTEEGISALRQRLKGLIDLFNKNEFPFKCPILGFCNSTILNQEDCKQRIIELSELIGYPLKIKKHVDKVGDEEIIKKEEIIYSEKWQ